MDTQEAGANQLRVIPYIRSVRRVPALRRFPDFRIIMSKWEELLISHYQDYINHFVIKAQKGVEPEYETYTLTVDYGPEEFNYVWNVDNMTQYIYETNMETTLAPVNFLFENAVYSKELYERFIPTHPENPIIIINDINNDYLPLALNGNHRIRELYQKGQTYADVYLFQDNSHTVFMETKFQELFWKFNSDIRKIEAIVLAAESLFTVEQTLEKLHLYKELKIN